MWSPLYMDKEKSLKTIMLIAALLMACPVMAEEPTTVEPEVKGERPSLTELLELGATSQKAFVLGAVQASRAFITCEHPGFSAGQVGAVIERSDMRTEFGHWSAAIVITVVVSRMCSGEPVG